MTTKGARKVCDHNSRVKFRLVGGLVGMIGGLGGFVLPITFGAMNDLTGVWTSCFMLLFALVAIALVWMHFGILRVEKRAMPDLGEPKFLPELGHPEDAKHAKGAKARIRVLEPEGGTGQPKHHQA